MARSNTSASPVVASSTAKRILPTLIILVGLFGVVCADSAFRSADIPLTYDDRLVPKAKVTINGTPMDLSIDTGSSFAFQLTLEQIEAIGASPSTEKCRMIDAAGNIQEHSLYVVKRLNLAGMDLQNAKIVPLRQWELMHSGEGEPPTHPLIGLGAFAGKVQVLDFKNNQMRVADGSSKAWLPTSQFAEYPFIQASDGLVFNVEHAGRNHRLIVDSGAPVSAIWEERLITRNREPCTIAHPEINTEGCGTFRLSTISNYGARDAFTAVAVVGNFDYMEDVDGLIGNNFPRTRTVIADFQNKRVWVGKPAN